MKGIKVLSQIVMPFFILMLVTCGEQNQNNKPPGNNGKTGNNDNATQQAVSLTMQIEGFH